MPLDLIRWGYYYRFGYDRAEERRHIEADGPEARFVCWKPFEVQAVEEALSEFRDAIIDFGAGHLVQEDAQSFNRVTRALASADHVILLLPNPDTSVSQRILLERLDPPEEEARSLAESQAAMLASPCNAHLATATVYTAGKTPEETCDEIMALLG